MSSPVHASPCHELGLIDEVSPMPIKPIIPLFPVAPKKQDFFVEGILGSSIGKYTPSHAAGVNTRKTIEGIFKPLNDVFKPKK
jgi:hypothetical protein